MPTRELSPNAFLNFQNTERKLQSGTSIFHREDLHVGAIVRRGATSLVVKVLGETASDIEVGDHLREVNLGNRDDYFVYPRENAPMLQKRESATSPEIQPAPKSPPVTGKPTCLNEVEAAKELQKYDPSHIVFCTGAGISTAGKVPILDHIQTCQQIGLAKDEEKGGREKNRQLRDALLTDPKLCETTLELFKNFYDHLLENASTPAHIALASIIRKMDLEPTLLTTNHDLKHEAIGSQICAVEVVNNWRVEENYGLPYYQAKRQLARYALEHCAQTAKLAVIIGASEASLTRREITPHLRHKNPNIKILGMDLQSDLGYLGKNDFLLQGDVQELLPELNNLIS